MKTEYRIRLLAAGKFLHNVYIKCECINKISDSEILADGVKIDFILEIGSIEES